MENVIFQDLTPKVNSYIVLNIIGHVDGSFDKIFDKYILKSNNI